LITGIGDAFSAASFGSSAVLDSGSGALIGIDCPGAAMKMYAEAAEKSGIPIAIERLDDILLTHLHGDHSDGLETLGFVRRYVLNADRPRLHAIPEVLDRVWEKLAPSMDGATREQEGMSRLEDYFEPCPMDPAESIQIGGLTVSCRRTRHSVPTAGFKIQGEDGTFGWSADTEYEQAHVDWLADADLIVHECGLHFKHTRWEELDELPDALKSKIRLIHLPDGHDVPEGPMRVLREGDVLTLPV